MTHNEAEPIFEEIFENAVRKIAPRNSQIYSKLIMGLQAERDLFERKCEEMSAELARSKQRKMAERKFMTSDFWLGWIGGSIVTFISTMAGVFINRGLIH